MDSVPSFCCCYFSVRQYDNATVCGLVWTANFVAYRCRTCAVSPCMSLCADCFQAGNHTGHDYNMFRSQAGGACDCGDVNVMNTEGWALMCVCVCVCVSASLRRHWNTQVDAHACILCAAVIACFCVLMQYDCVLPAVHFSCTVLIHIVLHIRLHNDISFIWVL